MGKTEIQPSRGPFWPVSGEPGPGLPAELLPSSAAAAPAFDISLATLVKIILEWRWVILGSAAVGLALGLVLTLLATPFYRASAVLEMNPPTVEVLGGAKGGTPPIMAADSQFLATQYGLLQSRSLAERVAQSLNLGAKLAPGADRQTRDRVAVGTLVGGLRVTPLPNSRLVRIDFTSADPGLAAAVANSFADNFINSSIERKYEASTYARHFLERQIERLKGEIESTERRLVAYAQRQGLVNVPSSAPSGGESQGTASAQGGSLSGSSLAALNQALAAAQMRRIAAEQKYRQSAVGGAAEEVNANTATFRAQKAALESEYQEKLTIFKPDYPDMVRLRSRIQALDAAIRNEAKSTTGGRSTSLLSDYRAAAAEEAALAGRVNQLKAAVLSERGRGIQYNILQRELDTNRSLYDALLQRYREIGIAGGVGSNPIAIVDRAEVPAGPYTPNLMLNLLAGLIAGLVAGFVGALALEILNDVVKTPDDVREKLGLPALGVIPRKAGAGAMSEELKEPTSHVSEAYFSLVTALQFSGENGLPKSLLITSTRQAEGKSSTTLALAQNLARLGRSVLLIDGDLRKPAFVTGLDAKEGISKLLASSEPIENHILATDSDNLSLLPCGPIPPNPAELLASPRLAAIVREAAARFEVVIVDGPPVLGLADAPLLSSACEATLLVVESGKTRTRAARDAISRLRTAGGRIVGAALTKFRYQAHGYGYGYGYGYRYEPYKQEGLPSREREIKLIRKREA